MSVFVACDLAAGAAMSTRPAEERRRVDQLLSGLRIDYPDDRFPAAYASLLALLKRGKGRISTIDSLIAASAVLADAALITGNAKDFGRVPGLDVLTY
jgi:tRNA(fMet)-specific endonuclease VapC